MTAHGPERRPAAPFATTLACFAVVTLAGQVLPANVHAAGLLPFVVATAGWSRSRRFLWGVTGVAVVVAFVDLATGAPRIGLPQNAWLDVVNRAILVLATFATAVVADRWMVGALALADRNAALDAANAELAAHEEEVMRMNEELERQSEELRLSNDDLAARERLLGRLLDLSRSLAGELRRQAVLTLLCETTTSMMAEEVLAAAIVMREGDVARVVCHLGFGDEPPDATELPIECTFTGLVLSRGQTGFLEDLDLRADLRVPQPRTGAAFRAVIGAPIHAGGRPIGTVEAYGRAPMHWTDDVVSLITAIATQASISLESARLFEEVDAGRRRSEAVLRTLPVGVLVADDVACRHVTGNRIAAAMFNVPVDADFSPLAPGDVRVRRTVLRNGVALDAAEWPLVRAVTHGEEVSSEELQVVLPNGRRLDVLASAAPVYGATGTTTGGVCALVDISVVKELQRELQTRRREAEESSVRKTRFLAAVSHDIRTPANAIRLQAELIKRSSTTPDLLPRVTKLADDLQRNATSLVDLVSEVLDLTRFDTGRVELQESDFVLATLVEEECRQQRPVADRKGLALVAGTIDPRLVLHADRIKLGRMIGNLIENGIKFTSVGEVRLDVSRRADGGVEIRVSDTGAGIPTAHLPRIFDEFYQLRNPERDLGKGRGLGLSICRRLADAMGGAITVTSEVGIGSAFTVALPPSAVAGSSDGSASAGAASAAASDGLSGVRVLVVEDHDDSRTAIGALLRAEGALVDEAADGRAAIAAIESGVHEVLLLDLMLPQLDGLGVLAALRHAPTGHVLRRIVVLTGDGASRAAPELQRLGVDHVLAKPVDPARIVAALRD